MRTELETELKPRSLGDVISRERSSVSSGMVPRAALGNRWGYRNRGRLREATGGVPRLGTQVYGRCPTGI